MEHRRNPAWISERYAAIISKTYESTPHPSLSLTAQQFVEQIGLRARTEHCTDTTPPLASKEYVDAADRWILDETHYFFVRLRCEWKNNQFTGLTHSDYRVAESTILHAATRRAIEFFTKNPSATERGGDPENLRVPLQSWM